MSAPPDDVPTYGLDDDEASRLLHAVVVEVVDQVRRGEVDRRGALVRLSDGVTQMRTRFPDVDDVTTRTEVLREVNPVLAAAGEQELSTFEW